MSNIKDIRTNIDKTDEEIVAKLVERMKLAEQVAKVKEETRKGVTDGLREREVIEKVVANSGKPFDRYTRIIYNSILETSKAYQHSLTNTASEFVMPIKAAMQETAEVFPREAVVACQGLPGAYSESAALKMIPGASIMYFNSFESVFEAVEKGLCQYGVLPIENSNNGSIGEIYDLMQDHHDYIVRSTKHMINHCLLAKPGTKEEDIKEIFSHEQALGQCRKYLAAMEGVKITASDNTATAAKAVAESDRADIAAISSADCAELYGLEVIRDFIQVNGRNFTRFICISKDMEIYPGDTKVSLMLRISHKPMSLYHTMGKFSTLGINICKLESRPLSGSDFEFTFYFDLDATIRTPEVMQVIGELAADLDFFVFLGAYQEV